MFPAQPVTQATLFWNHMSYCCIELPALILYNMTMLMRSQFTDRKKQKTMP